MARRVFYGLGYRYRRGGDHDRVLQKKAMAVKPYKTLYIIDR